MRMASPEKPANTSTPRIDGVGKVTGAAEYTADVAIEGALWAKVLRSPHAHARITRVDASKARAFPGVHAVITGDDVPRVLSGRRIKDLPIIAQDVVRFVGEQVAAVAAIDEETAERALALIEIEYDPLPMVLDPEEALADGAPLVHPYIQHYGGLPKPLDEPSNRFVTNVWAKGDIEAGFAEAHMVIDNVFTTSMMHQAYMEPNAWIVLVDEDGRTQVWASNKTPYPSRRQIAGAMELDAEQMRFNPVTIGGDFGGKGQPRNIPLCYHLAKAAGRPVRMVFDYTEEFGAANPRHPAIIHMRTGVKNDGTITAHEAEMLFDSGAYAGFIPAGFVPAASNAGGTYHIPNVRVTSSHVYTNKVPRGYMRGPGRQQATFAMESQMDCVAHSIAMDPADLRRANVVRDGEETSVGERFRNIKAIDTLEAAIAASGYGGSKPRHVGRGISLAHQEASGGETRGSVALNPDGTVVLSTPVFEQGTGTYTILQQVVAERLGLPVGRVTVRVMDTDGFDFDSGMSAQRGTRVGSHVAHEAASAAEREMAKLAADLLGWPEESITISGDDLRRTDTDETEPWATLVQRTGAPVVGSATLSDDSAPGITAFTTQVAEVSVDTETGQVRLLKLTTAHDTGRILNPQGHQGQINGAAVQGMGYALMEELLTEGDDGRVTTLSFADYKIPTTADLFELQTVLLESDDGTGPLGVKGIAENASTPAAAAIANAIDDACGLRALGLPLTAERVYRALRERDDSMRATRIRSQGGTP
jgi:CO/xanthine dehydrogenase Mo-binding subunit